METREYLSHFVSQLHKGYEAALTGLTNEQLSFRPGGRANHIAFIAWHWVRTEDNIIQFVLQRKPTVWLEMELNEKWNPPRNEQGTGIAMEIAHNLAVPSADAFLDYARAVWKRVDAYLAALTPEELERVVKVNPFGELSVFQAIGQTLIAHGNEHLGQIGLTREIQGLGDPG